MLNGAWCKDKGVKFLMKGTVSVCGLLHAQHRGWQNAKTLQDHHPFKLNSLREAGIEKRKGLT